MKASAVICFCLFAAAAGLASGEGGLSSATFPGANTPSSGSSSGAASNTGYQSGYAAGVSAAIATCQKDPLSCNIFDSVRYWEAYYSGVDVAINVCKMDPGSCGIEGAPWFNQGYSAGTAAMMASCVTDPLACGVDMTPWYDQGISAGVQQGQSDCANDPIACGVLLSSVLPEAAFGETEPNDHLIAADPLVLDSPFWGQSYGNDDTDFYYLETQDENQTLVMNFQVPGTSPDGWVLRVRDAAGNVFATVDTDNAATTVGEDNDITYTTTLGLAGTYYVEVKCDTLPVTSNPYQLTAMLQDSPLDTGNFQIGFYDAEVEFNDWPSAANPLATGVTMYGLINLTFDVAIPQDDEFVWAQGEPDWFKYRTNGNEIITLTFCAKEDCGPGDWFVDVYNAAGAQQLEAGASEQLVDPILAFNTSNASGADQEPEAIRFGLKQPGTYYIRVDHKRLFTAPCAGYETDWDNDGLPSGPPGAEDEPAACACNDGYTCSKTVKNPVEVVVEDKTWPACPWNFVGSQETCQASCECSNEGSTKKCSLGSDSAVACACPDPLMDCNVILPNPGVPVVTETVEYDFCPDGSGGGTSNRCQIGCVCTQFGGVVEVPEGAVTGQYNFTWYGTKLPPFTSETDAFDDFENRATPY